MIGFGSYIGLSLCRHLFCLARNKRQILSELQQKRLPIRNEPCSASSNRMWSIGDNLYLRESTVKLECLVFWLSGGVNSARTKILKRDSERSIHSTKLIFVLSILPEQLLSMNKTKKCSAITSNVAHMETWFIDCNNICHTSYNQTARNWEQWKEEKLSRMANKSDSVWVFMRLFGFILTSFQAKKAL